VPSRLLFAATGIGASVALAWLSWHFYESQILKLKRYFPYGRRRAAGRTAAPARGDEPAATVTP
jgi:peptidoglycan/LPS O-acetylase OafA/YrhL